MGIPRLLAMLLALLAITWLMPHVLKSQEPIKSPTDADIKEQVARLDLRNATSERMEAIKWLRGRAGSANMRLAIPALEKCILAELDAKIRVDSIACLAMICRKLKVPCPLFIVDAVLDENEEVSSMAFTAIDVIRTYPAGSLEVFLKCARSTNPNTRSSCLHHIVYAGGKTNKEALKAIEHATEDKEFGVRNNAQVAIFQAKGDLDRFLTYLVRRQEDPKSLLGPVDFSTEAGKRELERATNVVDPATWLVAEWSDTRPDDLVTVLFRLLSDPSPPMRRGASKLMGISAVKMEFEIVGGISKQKRPAKAEPSKALAAMEKSGVEDRLKTLSEKDMDETVRKAAGEALKLIHSIKGK